MGAVSGRLAARAAFVAAPIVLRNLTLTHERRPAVHHLSGTFAPASLTAIVGPNGAGKTTLLRAIAGLHAVAEGVLDLGGLPARAIGLLPQASALDRGFPVSCLDVVALGALGRVGAFARMPQAELDRAADAMARVGMQGFERRPVGSLSAGQFQRVLFARLIVQDAPVMLLDEPTSAVDARTEAALLGLMHGWHEEGRTVIAVLHDLELVAAHFPQTLLLAREAVGWGRTGEVLTPENRLRARLAAEAWVEAPEICDAPHSHAA